jgi:hypothetical protein
MPRGRAGGVVPGLGLSRERKLKDEDFGVPPRERVNLGVRPVEGYVAGCAERGRGVTASLGRGVGVSVC